MSHSKRQVVGLGICAAVLLQVVLSTPAGADALPDAHRIVQALYTGMLRNLPIEYQARGSLVHLVVANTPGIQAESGYEYGQPTITVNLDALDALMRLSYYVAALETGHRQELLNVYRESKPVCYSSRERELPLPSNWRARSSDRLFMSVWITSLRSISCFVLGHELGHLCMCHQHATGSSLHSLMYDQQQELEADRFGIYAVGWNRLDYRSVLIFCQYMGELEPEVEWPYPFNHPGWRTRERDLRMIIQAL